MQLIKHENEALLKKYFIPAVLVFSLFFLISPYLHSQGTHDVGYKYFKNYSYKEYDHQAQNWGIAQAQNGIIYVANHGGVLEFDGVSWRIIDVPNHTVHSIAIDKEGVIYIGGKNEIGFLAPDSKGMLKYNSLRRFLPNNQSEFSDVWKTYATEKGIYFQSPEFLFRWNPHREKMNVWIPVKRFNFSFSCAGRLFIRQENIGLMEMIDDSLQPVPGGEIFKAKKIFMMTPFNTQEILIGTNIEGFHLYTGTRIIPFPTDVDDYLKKNILYHGIRLSSGDYALATLHGGLVIMAPRGRLKYTWNKTSGLQDDSVYYVFEDSEENLWLCLSKGISRIENASPLSIHDERSGLVGILMAVARHNNDLYIGTTDGLFYLESSFKFSLIPGITAGCWDLASTGDSLLAATSGGVFLVDKKKNSQYQVIKDPAYVLLQSTYRPGRIWCGTGDRLAALSRENGQWQEERRYQPINQEIRAIAEEKNGDLWLVTATGGVLKMESMADDPLQPPVTWYETSHGLPGGRVYAAPAADHVMFATEKGLFRYDDKKNIFIPDLTIGGEFAGGPSTRNVFRIIQGIDKNIWIHSESRNYQAIPTKNGLFTIYNTPFLRIPLMQVNAIYPDPEGKITWFASFDGLFRYDKTFKKNYAPGFKTFIRKVSANEQIIFDGFENKIDVQSKLPHPLAIIDYNDRNLLQFEFAAPFFEAETETRYRYFLEGYEKEWSDWNKGTRKNYTNLDSGLYAFRVQAKNVFEHQGDEDIFRFRILLPWYRTWWAILSYILVVFLLTYLVSKWWRSIKLEQEKEKLEYTIKERTKEIQVKNLQLKEQSEKLEEMDRVKSRFFANLSHEFRTPLTLIMGPIEQMLSDSRDQGQKSELNIMLRNAQRLLTLINQLLDLSRFDSGQVKLQATHQDIVPFLKSILSSFRLVTQKYRLELEFQSEKDSISLYFDPPKMEEVMYNLLINAVRFTSPGGKITVSVTLDQPRQQDQAGQLQKGNSSSGFVNLSVRDTGIGIPLEQLPFIFDRFFQAKGPRQEAMKGTGIGLSLVKENVVLHHGRINVHSQEGKGSEFVIRLPLGHEHLKPEEIAVTAEVPPSQTAKDSEFESLLMLTENNTESDVARETEGEIKEKGEDNNNNNREQEKPVILVVEDHVEVRKYICKPLRLVYTVVEAGNGKEGIEKAREIIPDLIVSDIMMPEVDGVELCRKLKTDIKTSHIPIILLTAKASEQSIIQGLETGADDYITKPFNAKILLARIKNLIELRRQLQQKIQKQMLLQPVEIAVSSMDRQFIEEIQAAIDKNLSNPKFNVEDLSKKLYMNRATLYRKMMALTGEPPVEFIRSYRLKRAAQLLRDKFGTVSQVALEVGFDNPAYFAKCFKEKFQQLPSSYQVSEAK